MNISLFTSLSKQFRSARNKVRNLSTKKRAIFAIAFLGMTIGATGMVRTLFFNHSTVLPAQGGTVTEGVVGAPRFINPVLAESNTDLDLTRLTFSGLMKRDPQGDLIPDLAQSYSISEDGKTYLFTLREGLKFHDGHKLTASDVVFTINQTQVSSHQSPHRETWQGIKAVVLDPQTVQFTLPQAFAGFLEQTTLGILPSHIWQTVPAEQFSFSTLNAIPVGSGPFFVHDIKRDKAGVPQNYVLKSNKHFWSGEPFIYRIVMRFYPNETELLTAFTRGDVDTMAAISPNLLEDIRYDLLVTTPLPRIFGLYLNTTRNTLLQDDELIAIIDKALDKQALVDKVLNTFGSPLHGPLPPTISTLEEVETSNTSREELQQELEDLGWEAPAGDPDGIRQKDGTALQFSIATSDIPELTETATLIKQNLAEIGILVTINVFEIRNLELDIIQPRNFESLLFGQVVRHDTDLYAFWHSSQSTSEGLNITNYDNTAVDEALTGALQTLDEGLRRNLYRTVEEQITTDKPAVFLYSPHLVYVTNRTIGDFDIGVVSHPADRLNQANTWYVNTERVWDFLTK